MYTKNNTLINKKLCCKMLADSWETVYVDETNIIEILIVEVNKSSVSYYTPSSYFLSAYDLVRNFTFVFGNVKKELGTKESCLSSFNFSSGSILNNDELSELSTPSDIS